MNRLLISLIIAALFYPSSYADIILIPEDYSTIQMGVDHSNSGDTVLVSPNIYHENVTFNDRDIIIASMFLTTGDSSYIYNTTLSGGSSGSVITLNNIEGVNLAIIGLTITNGLADEGGGIYCYYANPLIKSNIISQNLANATIGAAGGGIYCNYSEAKIIGNTIEMNYSDGALEPVGGGVYCVNCSPEIGYNIIKYNSASEGGGIYVSNGSPTIIKNLIVGNQGFFGGGGIYAENSVVSVVNCTFSGNDAQWYKGGAIYFNGNYLTIENSILFYDDASIEDPELHLEAGIAELSYTDIDGGWDGTGNFDTHPLFRNLENDFHLMATECGDSEDSPLIDMGNPDILDEILDCDYGLGSLASDMGVYGGGDSAGVGIDEIYIPDEIVLLNNYPNPFNAQTQINYSLNSPGHINLDIYDMLGRKIITLVNQYKPAGDYIVNWDANEYSTGIYLAKLKTGSGASIIKLTLLK